MKRFYCLSLLILSAFFTVFAQEKGLDYPQAKRENVSDDYYGIQISDPYRWMEEDSVDLRSWIEAENRLTLSFLEKIPFREALHKKIETLYDYPKYDLPFRVGEYVLFFKEEGLQNQGVLYLQKGLEGKPKVLVDVNTLSQDGSVTLQPLEGSQDGRYLALSRSEAGSDQQEIRVFELSSGRELPDRIGRVRFSGAAWYEKGFFYSGDRAPGEKAEPPEGKSFQRVYYHRLGTEQGEDQLVYEERENPQRFFSAAVTEDGKYLLIYVSEGTGGTKVLFRPVKESRAPFKTLLPGFENTSTVLAHRKGRFLVLTNAGAPNFRIVSIDPLAPDQRNWKEVIAERPEVIAQASVAGAGLFVGYLRDGVSRFYQFTPEGKEVREIPFPVPGTAVGFTGKWEDRQLFYYFTSYTYPSVKYLYDTATGRSTPFFPSRTPFDPTKYETKQLFYKSKDGTQVPLFLVYRRGLAKDGKRPVYLTGDGGFAVASTPFFNPSNLVVPDAGGIYAVACIRGGSEYGEGWHRGGMLLNKPKSFEDFIAAAEFLIEQGYTSPKNIGIAGASNGGLLVGAVMTKRPDLFAVALPTTGIMDMLRYHKFTIGWGWAPEYGRSDKIEHFSTLYSYSPLHNIKEGVQYPATLVATSDRDERVVPAHSFKFTATLQEKQSGNAPVLIRVGKSTGHGGEKSLNTIIDETADALSFFFYNLNITPAL